MKRVVVNDFLDEIEVHPKGLFQNFIDICTESSEELLKQKKNFVESSCPACSSPDKEHAFGKYGYTYWICSRCATLFISPRPSAALIEWYLKSSPVSVFRSSNEYQKAMNKRITEQAAYRAGWLYDLCKQEDIDGKGPIIDLETRSKEFVTELKKYKLEPLILVQPSENLENSLAQSKESPDIAHNLGDIAGSNARVISMFDILEHQSNPFELLQSIHEALGPDGLLVMTTRSGSGFDIQVLWGDSTILPVEHMNLISIEGMRLLLKKVGFELLEISTPGQLDVQMIERVFSGDSQACVPYFIKYFLKHRDSFAKNRLQQFLQENLLSSHLRIVAKKNSVGEKISYGGNNGQSGKKL